MARTAPKINLKKNYRKNDKYKQIDVKNMAPKYKNYLEFYYKLISQNNRDLNSYELKRLIDMIFVHLNKKAKWNKKHYTFDNSRNIVTYQQFEYIENTIYTICGNCGNDISIDIRNMENLINWLCSDCKKVYPTINSIKKNEQLFKNILNNNNDAIKSKLKHMQNAFHTMNRTKRLKLFKLI